MALKIIISLIILVFSLPLIGSDYTSPNSTHTSITLSFSYKVVVTKSNRNCEKVYVFKLSGNITRITRKNSGGTVTYSDTYYDYDEMNRNYRIRQMLDTTEIITQKQFDRNSRVVMVRDANNHDTKAYYDGLGRVYKTEDYIGNHVDYTLDANSNVITMTEYERITTTDNYAISVTYNEYDNLDRLISSTNPISATRQMFYDSRNNLTHIIDGENRTITKTHDGINRLLQVTRPGDITTQYEWDDNSRLLKITDDNSKETNYLYDNVNRRKRETLADSTYKEFTYDDAGNITNIRLNDTTQITQVFDDINRLTSKSISKQGVTVGVDSEDYTYDGIGRLTEAKNYEGQTQISKVVMTYDMLNRLLAEEQTWGALGAKTTQHQYDSVGNRTKLIYPYGASSYVDFDIDSINRITNIKNPSSENIASYEYVGYRVQTRSYKNLTKLTTEYDNAKRLTGLLHENTYTSAIINQFAYGYDKENNRLFEKRVQEDVGDLFRYNSIYQLTKAQYDVPTD